MKNINYYEEKNSKIRNTLNSTSPNWSKDQIIRFLYKNLSYFVKRDLHFFLQNNEGKQKQISNGIIDRFPNIICYTLAEFYCAAFKEFGINANITQANSSSIPLYAIVIEGDYGNYYLNPLEDLFLNQYGLKPKAFGFIPKYKTINTKYPNLIKLPKEYLTELDKSLNFTYLDDYFKELKLIMKNYPTACTFLNIENNPRNKDLREQKVNYISNNLINKGKVHGIYERAQLYHFLDENLLNKTEKKHTKVFIENDSTNKPFISYNIIKLDETITYHEEKTDKGYTLIKHR